MNKLNITVLVSFLLVIFVAMYIQQEALSDWYNHPRHNRPDALKLIALLQEKDYAELNRIILARREAYKKNVSEETNFSLVMYGLANGDPAHEALMTEWIDEYPDSYIPHLVRGVYYVKLGYSWRNTNFVSGTSAEQFEKYHFYHDKAYRDLKRSIALEPTTEAYGGLISLSSNARQGETMHELFTQGLALLPESYSLRRDYLHKLTPRWGGSNDQINALINDIHPHLEANAALKPLLGFMHYEMSHNLKKQANYRLAISEMNTALSFGGKSWYFRERGTLNFFAGEYKKALLDFNKALKYFPHSATALEWRASTYVKLERYKKAMADLDLAAQLVPYGPRVHYERGNLHHILEQYAEVVEDYRKVLHYEGHRADLWYSVGDLLHTQLKQHKQAAEALKIATDLEPDKPGYWYKYSLALDKSYDCKVIPALDKYLSLCQEKCVANTCGAKYQDWAKEVSAYLINNNKCPALDTEVEDTEAEDTEDTEVEDTEDKEIEELLKGL